MNTALALQRLRQVLRRQHKALFTESNYIHWLRHYILALRQMPETLSSEQKLERFLTHLACRRNVSASSLCNPHDRPRIICVLPALPYCALKILCGIIREFRLA